MKPSAIFTFGLALALAPLSARAAASDFAILHARAWTGASQPIENATIVVRDGKIAAVVSGLAGPAGLQVIDAEGRTVTPGLMNASTQLGLIEVSGVDETADAAVKASPLGAAFDVQYALNANSEVIEVARADGVTRAIAAPTASGASPFSGQAALVHLMSSGETVLERPRAALFASIGGGSDASAGGSRAAQWQLLRNALDEARRYSAQSKSSLPARDQLLNHLDAEALAPVLEGRAPLVIAVDRESDILQAIQLGEDDKIRIIVQGGAEAWRAADRLAAAKVPVILDPFANLPTSFDEIGARLDNAAILQRHGVLIAFALTDTFSTLYRSLEAGLALREAAGLAVANGLPWPAALDAITVNPSRIFGLADHYGALAAGQDADLVVWNGDPLDVSGWPDMVFVGGQPASLQTRQTRLHDRYTAAHRAQPFGPAYR